MVRRYDPMKKNPDSISKKIADVLPAIMQKIDHAYAKKPAHVLEAWPQIIGEKLAPFTKAVSVENGTLVVKVKNSTLLSLLSREEKSHILKKMQERFSQEIVRNIIFRIG